jgi:hypothetical protein
MKKLFYVLMLLVLTAIYTNAVFAQTLPPMNYLTFKNDCKACNSIRVSLTGASFSDVVTLGSYGAEVGWENIPGGNYTLEGDCLSGISKHWETTLFIESYSALNQGKRFTCPEYNNTTTTTTVQFTTTTASSQPCTSETIYGEDSEETELLRSFRDNVLSQTPEGQELIRLYYQWSPVIVKAMESDEEFKEEIKEMIDGVWEMIEVGVE